MPTRRRNGMYPGSGGAGGTGGTRGTGNTGGGAGNCGASIGDCGGRHRRTASRDKSETRWEIEGWAADVGPWRRSCSLVG